MAQIPRKQLQGMCICMLVCMCVACGVWCVCVVCSHCPSYFTLASSYNALGNHPLALECALRGYVPPLSFHPLLLFASLHSVHPPTHHSRTCSLSYGEVLFGAFSEETLMGLVTVGEVLVRLSLPLSSPLPPSLLLPSVILFSLLWSLCVSVLDYFSAGKRVEGFSLLLYFFLCHHTPASHRILQESTR